MKLTELSEGRKGRIIRIHLNQQDCERLLAMGIFEGACIYVERNSIRNGLLVLLVYGNFLMIRHQDAANIEVIQDEEDCVCR